MFTRASFLFALLFAPPLAAPAGAADCPRPAALQFDVTGKIVRSAVGFTQGLEWRDGKLFESTGAVGNHSGLNTIGPDGTVTNLLEQGTKVFGEGLTILDDEIYQLTWQEHEVFVYGLDGKLRRTMRNLREGWGRVYDDATLYRAGKATLDHAREIAPHGTILVDDPALRLHSAEELEAEFDRGLAHGVSDLNPMRLLRDRP